MPLPQITREKLAEVFRSPETLRTFEALLNTLQFTPEQLTDALAAAAAAQATANAAAASAAAAQTTANTGVANAAAAQSTASAAQTDITTHKAATSAHGVTGNIVGTDGTQTLKNKTLDGSTPMTTQSVTTGAATATLSANKPGANSGVAGWLKLNVNGTDYYLPLWT